MQLETVQQSLKSLLEENTAEAAPELVRHLDDNVVQCFACGHRCRILPGRPGVCRVRFNDNGRLRVPWGYVAGLQIDPIEKKPFFHVLPGAEALSFGMLGCDLRCSYCQNWVTSQALKDRRAVAFPRFCSARQLVDLALEHRTPALVSTYNEPLITAEWAVEIFRLAAEHRLVCGFVSNGHATDEVLDYLRPYMQIFKVDLKSFSDAHYRELGGILENVLQTIRGLKQRRFWVEVVTLVVPGFNDSDTELSEIASFLASVDPDIPWHVTAFHPDYKMTDTSRTPVETLIRAAEIGRRQGLRFVYAGNLPGMVGEWEHTRCPDCGRVLIERYGFQVTANRLRDGCCDSCGRRIPGVWTVDEAFAYYAA